MSRYIDADALKRYIDDCDVCTNCKEKKLSCDIDCPMPDCLTKDWERVIDEQPTVDAVPVVRCRECKYAIISERGIVSCYNVNGYMRVGVDFYCADGERKDGESDERNY